MKEVSLADIGNSRIHIFRNGRVYHYGFDEAIAKYRKEHIYYISVNHTLQPRIDQETSWQNISSSIALPGAYDTMGTDRKALCLSKEEGVFIDAGSALTVDFVWGGIYRGGWLFPGIQTMKGAYGAISPALEIDALVPVELDRLPRDTSAQISYGIIAPIIALIIYHRGDLPVFCTGGDGELFASLLEDAHYSEGLVFEGMKKVLEQNGLRAT